VVARRHRQRTLLLALVGLAALAIGVVGYATHVFRASELSTVDARFSVRGPVAPPKDVVLVGLDSQSLATLHATPPIRRRLHAKAIDILRRDGAKVIAYDFQFTTQTTVDDDNALFAAVGRAGNLVLVTTSVNQDGDSGILGGDKNLRQLRAVPASSNYPTRATRGGTYRRIPYSVDGLTSFAVATAQRATGKAVDRSEFSGDGAWIDFAGRPGTVPTISFSDLLAGRVPPSKIRGKVVVVGATSPALQDIHPAATGTNMPGPEINVNAIATILDGFPLQDVAGWLAILIIAAAALLTPLSALRFSGLRWLPVTVVLAVAIPVGAQLAFNGGTIVPVVAPAVALLVAFLGTLAVTYAIDVRERRYLQTAFGRFVPPQVVDEVIGQVGDELRIGGTRREATVMFCDLRSFTAAAERIPAEQVIELLNRYLGEMSDAILDHGGTVVSYMGDGIMAVFGAPLPRDDHADRAVAAAREMLGDRLSRFNAWVAEQGVAEPFAMGIGICSGPVMSGNVGSTRRLEYAAVGDTTNTAARLEGMTKDAGCSVLIADSTRTQLTTGDAGLRPVGDLRVRGREAPLAAWTLA
jgi:adenylate cyclase